MPRRIAAIIIFLLLTFLPGGCKQQGSDPAAPIGKAGPSEEFLSLMNAGKNYLDQGDATNAIATYQKALAVAPNDADARLNLANAYLIAGDATNAVEQASEVLKVEPNSAAAYFVKGSAYLRLGNPLEAVKALQNSRRIDPGETATHFQLGLAHYGLKQWTEAITAFQEGIALEPNRLHTSAHYLLAQALLRAGRQDEAQQELVQHQATLEGGGGPSLGAAAFERSKHTQPRVPFKLDQPEAEGIPIRFVDATGQAFGSAASTLAGPVGVIDGTGKGGHALFVRESPGAFRILRNSGGTFQPEGPAYPVIPGAKYSKVLVGDLLNDRHADVIVLGEQGSHIFNFGTNGTAIADAALSSLAATDGILIDLDFTGKLDLVAVTAGSSELRLFRQMGPLRFADITSTSGIPSTPANFRGVTMENWNRDENMDLIASRADAPPLLLEKQRGGPLAPRNPTNWVTGEIIAAGDFDNDLRADLAILGGGKITICFNGGEKAEIEASGNYRQLIAVDYDNDGWLDLWAAGESMGAWRNRGLAGFQEQTTQLGLDHFEGGAISEIHFADFDSDCDSDIVLALAEGGLRYLGNEGGNANTQVKVQLIGNRSNASGIGTRVEIQTGGLRLIRTVRSLPVEVGVGKHQVLDSFLVHWFNWPQGLAHAPVHCDQPLLALELTIQEGSCPYVYAWDGEGYRFITDFLGAAPLGLPLAEGRYIESDPEELVWIGNEETFVPRNGNFELQITEELREVLYLDEARLVVVDHEPGTEAHSTDKLLPGKPFPPGEILTLHREHSLLRAETLEQRDVTAALLKVDGVRVSPPNLRTPQLRGLAEPHGVVLDFGPLDPTRPLVLVLNGWLRFGGGMANIAASHDPALPFPFPFLEAEISPGQWERIDVTVGAPAGKTKTIIVDLQDKLPEKTRRLRLTKAFEIHWDRIALLEKKRDARTVISHLSPDEAGLHFRGFSILKDLPPDWPLTPDYAQASPNSVWTLIPGGWCTRYGDISELITRRDEGLALINSGDELTLKFGVQSLPPKPEGATRQFFLYIDGWDKDSDFHVAAGATVEPLPFHGMDDQQYGRQKRPKFPSDALHQKYNTRWVEGTVLQRAARQPQSRSGQMIGSRGF